MAETEETVQVPPEAVDISPNKDGGILKEIKREGVSEDGPGTGDRVTVHYVGTLTDGSKFDSSRDRGDKFNFTLGKGEVIKAWDFGVATMKRGELCVITAKAEYAYGKNGSPPKIPPDATLVFEIELFDWKGEDVTQDKDEGVLRSIFEQGKGYLSPNEGASVEVHLEGRYNGRTFDERDVSFTMGEAVEAGIIDGIEVGLRKFHEGERSRLVIKPAYAFGSAGDPEKNIPPNATVEYEVTLKNFEKAKESWELELSEKIEQSEIAKVKGTNHFKAGNYSNAVKYYKKIIDHLASDEENAEGDEKTKARALLLAGNLNLAMCYLKLGENLQTCEVCDKAIELSPDSEKAYFRRGQAHSNMANFASAIDDFKKVLELDPNNKAAKNQITIASQKIKQEKEREKKLYGGMFDKFAKIDAKHEATSSQAETRDVFKNMDEWANDMASGMMTIEQEAEAFEEKIPESEMEDVHEAESSSAAHNGSSRGSKDASSSKKDTSHAEVAEPEKKEEAPDSVQNGKTENEKVTEEAATSDDVEAAATESMET